MNAPLNVIFAGTPEFAALHLQALIDSEHHVIAVYSQPDRPAGRGKKLQASEVKKLAMKHNIPIFQPNTLKTTDAQNELAALNADVMVVVAYGLILPAKVLNTPLLGCINVHGSLLPKWRGAAPIQRSIWAGDTQTGVSIMQMDEGLDTGPVLLECATPIETTDTSATLYEKLAAIGPKALLETLAKLKMITPQVQNNAQASYAKKLSKEEARINWYSSASQIERNVRAFNPWPVCYFEHANLSIKVWQCEVVNSPQFETAQPGEIVNVDKHGILVKTTEGNLLLKQLQLPGKKTMSCADILNGKSELFAMNSIIASVAFDE